MRKVIVFALLALALACSDREQTGPSTVPPAPSPTPSPTPTPTPGPRVSLSGRVFAATSGGADHSPAGSSLSARVFVVDGPNAGREVSSAGGGYRLADLEQGTMTLHFSTSGYVDQLRTIDLRADTMLDVGLEPGPWPGFVLSGVITEEWGDPVSDVGIEAVKDGRTFGGNAPLPGGQAGGYRIPTLPAGDYDLKVVKGGYLLRQPLRVSVTHDTTFNFVLSRSRVLLFGTVREAAPCAGAIEGVEVEVVSGPDVGVGVVSTATGYRTSRTLNWGKFRVRASKISYVPVEVAMDVPYPGSRCFSCPFDAPVEVEQNFVLQRTSGC